MRHTRLHRKGNCRAIGCRRRTEDVYRPVGEQFAVRLCDVHAAGVTRSAAGAIGVDLVALKPHLAREAS